MNRPGQRTIEGMSHADLAKFVRNQLATQNPDKAASYDQVDVHGVLNIKDKLNISPQAKKDLFSGYAPLASPVLLGDPQAPTPAVGDNDTSIATTAFVQAARPKVTVSSMAGGPPASPSDQDIWIATAVDANGTRWQFQYNAGSASAYKWEFIGGAPVISVVDAQESTASQWSALVDLATLGPAFSTPRAGDYLYVAEARASNNTAGAGMIFEVVAQGVGDSLQVFETAAAANQTASMCGIGRMAGVAANQSIRMQYCAISGGTAAFMQRRMIVTPIRVA